MKRLKIIVLVLIAAAIAAGIFLAIGRGSSKLSADVNLYFLNNDKTTIVSEKRTLSYNTSEEIIPKIIKELSKGPSGSDNNPVISKSVRLNSVDYAAPDTVVIDLNNKFLTEDSSHNILAAYAVIKSVCGASGLTNVHFAKVTVDGDDIGTADGKTIDFLSFDDIKLSDDTEINEKKDILLYFSMKDSDKLAGEMRSIAIEDNRPLEQYIVEELAKGPKSNQLVKTVTGEVISVETKEGVCFVNFKFSFVEKNSGSKNKETLAIYSVVNSLAQLDYIDGVQFLIDGKKLDKIGSIDVSGVLYPNESFNNS